MAETTASMPVSRRHAGRDATVLGTLAICLFLICLCALAVGSRPLGLQTLLSAATTYNADNFDHQALVHFRLPRLLAGLIVGGALALAGALLQALVRNPLAEPQLLGLNAGAAFAVVAVSVLGITVPGVSRAAVAAFGALAAFAMVVGLSGIGRLGATPLKITLCGIIVSAFASALTSALLLIDEQAIEELRLWLVGDLSGQSFERLGYAIPFFAAGVASALMLAPKLGLLSLGEDVARGLGVALGRTRLLAMLAAAVLSGCAVTLAGPVGFIGLIVPHLLRRVLSDGLRLQFLACLIAGPCLLIGADILARSVIAPTEIATGVLTGAAGAVVFIAIVARYFK